MAKVAGTIMPKKPDPIIEYVYAEPQTEVERADAEHRVSRAFDIIFTHLLTEYRKKKRSENHEKRTR
jgi:hypothetical protein